MRLALIAISGCSDRFAWVSNWPYVLLYQVLRNQELYVYWVLAEQKSFSLVGGQKKKKNLLLSFVATICWCYADFMSSWCFHFSYDLQMNKLPNMSLSECSICDPTSCLLKFFSWRIHKLLNVLIYKWKKQTNLNVWSINYTMVMVIKSMTAGSPSPATQCRTSPNTHANLLGPGISVCQQPWVLLMVLFWNVLLILGSRLHVPWMQIIRLGIR